MSQALVKFYAAREVSLRLFFSPLSQEAQSAIQIGQGVSRVNLYGFIRVGNGLFEVAGKCVAFSLFIIASVDPAAGA